MTSVPSGWTIPSSANATYSSNGMQFRGSGWADAYLEVLLTKPYSVEFDLMAWRTIHHIYTIFGIVQKQQDSFRWEKVIHKHILMSIHQPLILIIILSHKEVMLKSKSTKQMPNYILMMS